MKVFLIGFMGSGKSTIGRQLSKMLSLEFIDLDVLISDRENKTINQIFSDSGEEYFRNTESKVLAEILREDSFVMATGGGTPCFFDNMERMNHEGITVYLQLPILSLFDRLNNSGNDRPLLSKQKDNELLAYIATKLAEREKYYLQSKLIVDEKAQYPEALFKLLKNYNSGIIP